MSAHSFAALCIPHRASLMSKAMQLTCHTASAQDLVQDVMLKALTLWATFSVPEGEDPSDRAGAWLSRILKNKFITDYRTRVRHAKVTEARQCDLVLGANGEVGGLPCFEPVDVRFSGAVQRALSELSPLRREILVRADVHGETYAEIAEALDIQRITIHSRLYRARKQLAAILTRKDEIAQVARAMEAAS